MRTGTARAVAALTDADLRLAHRQPLLERHGKETTMPDHAAGLHLAPAVAAAVAERRAVVALESTIITHGMPWPENLETARSVEDAVRAEGATPATIAVLDGAVCVGLTAAQLEDIASRTGAAKASRRDLSAVVARRQTAGTTVAATMFLAACAKIPIFATGGIGGVHRGAETTFDISADLIELGRSPVAVVCAGAKSILDIPRTLEVLETQGVPVVGYGTDMFPAFYARSSGERLEHRFDTPADLAALIAAHRTLGVPGGILIANPVPEADALPAAEIEAIIARAVSEAAAQGVAKKAVTPFLLARIVELTEGRSLTANIALIRNNARLAARVAADLARLS
jgi:pseudouridine-5'-phosphate glycosidase